LRWIKHLTESWDDESLSAVTSEHGLEIYGFWWRISEIIGKQMDGTTKTSCRYSAKTWGKLTGVSGKKFRKLGGILAKQELIILKSDGDWVTVDIPNLLKYRDEYSLKKTRISG